MHTRLEKPIKHALFIKPRDIEVIYNILNDNYNDISIVAECRDGSTLTIESLDELLTYDNPSHRPIDAIIFESGHPYGSEGTRILLKDNLAYCANILVSGPDDEKTVRIAEDVKKLLHECKPYYALFSNTPSSIALSVIWFGILSIISWHEIITHKITHTDHMSFFSTIDMIYAIIPLLVPFLLFTYYFDRGWIWIFPRICFYLGRQQDRLEFRKTVRNLIFVTILLGVIISIAANLISNRL